MTPSVATPEVSHPAALLALARAVGDTEAEAVLKVVLDPPTRKIGFGRTEKPVPAEVLAGALVVVEYRLALTSLAMHTAPAEA